MEAPSDLQPILSRAEITSDEICGTGSAPAYRLCENEFPVTHATVDWARQNALHLYYKNGCPLLVRMCKHALSESFHATPSVRRSLIEKDGLLPAAKAGIEPREGFFSSQFYLHVSSTLKDARWWAKILGDKDASIGHSLWTIFRIRREFNAYFDPATMVESITHSRSYILMTGEVEPKYLEFVENYAIPDDLGE